MMNSGFWRHLVKVGRGKEDDEKGNVEGLLWYKDLGYHANGEFSMAVVQANSSLEDQSQIESGPLSSLDPDSEPCLTFIGVYDGHGGAEASCFVNQNLFSNLKKFMEEDGEISENVVKRAFAKTEGEFLSKVRQQWRSRPELAAIGTCCLVGLIHEGLLYIANAGDSRAVLGRGSKDGRGGINAIQLSEEHNANLESVRTQLRRLHPNDSQIVLLKHRVWRVKGIIQVSRSIGDAYLKIPEFNRDPLPPKFRLSDPFHKPILSSEPSIHTQKLNPNDMFLIFASDGLWEHISNQEAVNIVDNNPRRGIARKLVEAALRRAADKREMRFSDLENIGPGLRRHFHDDITVVVVFLQQSSSTRRSYTPHSTTLSIRGGGSFLNES